MVLASRLVKLLLDEDDVEDEDSGDVRGVCSSRLGAVLLGESTPVFVFAFAVVIVVELTVVVASFLI